jgi:hypothetical protein
MCEGIPEKSGKAAKDGTKTHYVLEYHLKNPDQNLIAGMSYDCPKEGRFHLEADRLERVQVALDYINKRKGELGEAVEVGAERWFDSTPAFGRSDLSGTSDIIITDGTVLEVIDYKDGMNRVVAENNEQMEIYGVCALFEMLGKGIPIQQVRLTVIQPKLVFNQLNPISTWDITADEMMARRETILNQAAMTDMPDAPLMAGEKQCKYCLAKGGCIEVNNKVAEGLGVNFQAVDVPAQVATIHPETVTNERLAEMMAVLPLMKQLTEVIESEALKRFKAGNPIDGFKLVKGRGSKTWSKEKDEVIARLKKLGIPLKRCTSDKPITATQALNIKWENTKGEEKTLTDRQKKILIEGYISVNQGSPKVVSINDPGDPIHIDVQETFEPVKTENVETAVETQPVIELPDWLK